MFKHFKRSRSPVLALRLTSLASQARSDIDRAMLLEGLLSTWSDSAGHMLEWFDIFGPYGIAKGRAVGLKAFTSKLTKRGHDDYHGYVAVNEEYGGCCASFFKAPPYATSFCEIVLWFRPSVGEIDAVEVVRSLATVLPLDYGYLSDLAENQDPMTESRIRRGVFGGMSVDVGTNSLSQWHRRMQTIVEGGVRDVYRINFLNPRQLARLQAFDNLDVKRLTDDLYALSIEDSAQQDVLRRFLVEACDVAL